MSELQQEAAEQELIGLIVSAFNAARLKGKPDWQRMTFAVLKNRLLQFSKGKFQESAYEASSFRDLLSRYPKLLRLDHDSVELLEGSPIGRRDSVAPSRAKIRPDLWAAAVDYSSGRRYAWDPELEGARPARPGDTLLVPTVTAEEVAAWRKTFTEAHDAVDDLRNWVDHGGSAAMLPARLRGQWHGYFRGKVHAHLEHWLAENGISAQLEITEGPDNVAQSEVEQVRRVIIECVRVMTAEELRSIQLPSTVVARAVALGRLT